MSLLSSLQPKTYYGTSWTIKLLQMFDSNSDRIRLCGPKIHKKASLPNPVFVRSFVYIMNQIITRVRSGCYHTRGTATSHICLPIWMFRRIGKKVLLLASYECLLIGSKFHRFIFIFRCCYFLFLLRAHLTRKRKNRKEDRKLLIRRSQEKTL